ncbi:hypothetical protein [Variovorax gossypii]|uniref:hypothetical protein n=1 Tax=Variovorax gossypii TaxID=1679495 RepID=UPI0014770AC4|nr:hypothetical protein [Variovorax gossypii]
MRSALTCAPMRDTDELRTGCNDFLGRTREIDAGNLGDRAVGNGDGSREVRMNASSSQMHTAREL